MQVQLSYACHIVIQLYMNRLDFVFAKQPFKATKHFEIKHSHYCHFLLGRANLRVDRINSLSAAPAGYSYFKALVSVFKMCVVTMCVICNTVNCYNVCHL